MTDPERDPELESFADRNDRLAADSPRQLALARAISDLEQVRRNIEGDLDAVRVLVVSAMQEEDDYSLRLVVDGLHRVHAIWLSAGDSDPVTVEHRGEIRGLHNVASVGLERMVPLALLAELEPDSMGHRMLAVIADSPYVSNSDLVGELGADKTHVSKVGTRLRAAGLARNRRAGRRNVWEITPRGAQTLNLLAVGGKPVSQGRHRTPA
jgi:hypothetical protein